MHTGLLRRWTSWLLILIPILFTAGFTVLQIQFDYPDILRYPTGDILRRMDAGGDVAYIAWYGMTLSALMFIPIAVLMHSVVPQASLVLWVGSVFGVIAGLVQAMGFLRWIFVVPHLAAAFVDPNTSAIQREALVITFDAFHRYGGMALGEHLGFICTAVWTACVAGALRHAEIIKPWFSLSGRGLALGILLGVVEPLGWAWAGAINAICYLLWAIWLVAIGIRLWLQARSSEPSVGRLQP